MPSTDSNMLAGRFAVMLVAGTLAAAGGWTALRPIVGSAPASTGTASGQRAALAPASRAAASLVPSTRDTSQETAAPQAGRRRLAADTAGTTLLAQAAAARQQGDLRTTLALLRAAVERAPSAETHAALGTLYLELGIPRAAEANLRAALEGDPGNADRWIALANALALEPDPMAAADALAQARAAEPGLQVARDAGGWLARQPPPAAP